MGISFIKKKSTFKDGQRPYEPMQFFLKEVVMKQLVSFHKRVFDDILNVNVQIDGPQHMAHRFLFGIGGEDKFK